MTVLDDLIEKLETQATTAMPVLAAWPNISADIATIQADLDHAPPDDRPLIEEKIERALCLLEAYHQRLVAEMSAIRTQQKSSHANEVACLAYNHKPKRPA